MDGFPSTAAPKVEHEVLNSLWVGVNGVCPVLVTLPGWLPAPLPPPNQSLLGHPPAPPKTVISYRRALDVESPGSVWCSVMLVSPPPHIRRGLSAGLLPSIRRQVRCALKLMKV